MQAKPEEVIFVKGYLNHKIMASTISSLAEKMKFHNISKAKITKIKMLSTEMIQNIFKHGEGPISKASFNAKVCDENIVEIEGVNFVSKSISKGLNSRLEKLKSLEKDNLREHYSYLLQNNLITQSQDVGLGLASIFYRSNGQVNYEFESVNNEFDLFSLKLRVLC